MKILMAKQMAEVDRLSTDVYQIPSLLLMENAGRAAVEEIANACGNVDGMRIVLFCGKGNNGGDGLVAARHLAVRGALPEIILLSDPSGFRGDSMANWQMVHAMGIPVRVLENRTLARRSLRTLESGAVVVDALFGTGLSKPIGADIRPVVDWINKASSRATVVSIDIPSGLFADSTVIPGPVVRAHRTVTFTALKLALVVPPASDCAGQVRVAPIGSPPALLDNPEYHFDLIDAALVRRVLPRRERDSHKGDYGHLFVMAGSRGKSGAALMTGHAALRSGAGLVTLLLPAGLQRDIIGRIPELMSEALPETAEGTLAASALDPILSSLEKADAVVIGPGLTTQSATRDLVRHVVRRAPVPIVLDADGINAFASKPEEIRNEAGQAVSITPHPGEMARLLGSRISEVQRRRHEVAQAASRNYGFITVLKGFQTVIAAPDGRVMINSSGNPGMATGGSGDVLAGMAGRFAAGWRRRFHGSDLLALTHHLAAAVYLHGLAGDVAAQEKGEESLLATDLLPCLPGAFKRVYAAGH